MTTKKEYEQIDKMFADVDSINRLRECREANGYSQRQVAELLNTSQQNIALYENGERTPKVDLIAKLANLYNVSIYYLLGLSSVKSCDMELQGVCDYTGLSERAVIMLESCGKNVSGYDEPNTGNLGLSHFMESIHFIDFATQLRDICRLYSDKITDTDIFDNLYFTNGELRPTMEVDNEVDNALELIERAGYTTIRKSQYFDLCIQTAEADLQRAFQDWRDELIKDVLNFERWD